MRDLALHEDVPRTSRNGQDRDRDRKSHSYSDKRREGGHDRIAESSSYGGSHRHRESQYERRGYGEHDRERERQRDRERYDRDRDGRRDERPSRRRSASPRSRRSSRPRSSSRDRSPNPEKAKPNFNQSGLLAAETNTVKATDGTSTVLKYNEPPEARKPTLSWRLYVFKGSEQVELLHIQRQSAYLIGRDRLVSDIAVDHPSCSKQHAAIQHRYIQDKGTSSGTVKPFVIDLESTNGTFVNDEKIPSARFYELKAGDVIKFGLSNREYVLLNEEAAS
ncbi:hypothetical protein AGABI1DRAFT_113933 [Agaricus bisporus var. burnettii JB137-S8]|nr:uncharacterized protein AGABI1DRAFT_113933 [Agaricus bisporus var. burnettii JB137-S8]EKM79360.1 hypothetical protein AGABI1DRAFT_113933 [Agaricus bisporus var. burnettii JB137-S8]